MIIIISRFDAKLSFGFSDEPRLVILKGLTLVVVYNIPLPWN